MKSEDYFCYGAFWIPLIVFGVWWIRMRLGLDKRWFVVPAAPFVSRGFYFALPTFVIGFAVQLMSMLVDRFNPRFNTIPFIWAGWILMGTGFVLAYLEPAWLSPAWYRWLKKEHGDILPELEAEANRLGRKEWLKRVQTQEDLERWVEEFRRNRYGAVSKK